MKPDWLFTRIIVVSLAVLTPLYFFVLFIILPFRMAPFGDPLLDWIFHFLIGPAVFSAPWLAFIYFERYRLANTVQYTQDTTTAVPLRWRLFYGTNAAFVLTFFILPIVTAPLAIIGGLIVAGNVFYKIGIGKLGGGKPAAALAVVVAIALCILPTVIMIEFLPQYYDVWQAILDNWSTFWFHVVYGFAQCLVNALSFSAPIYFTYFAAAEYDKGLYGEVYTSSPNRKIRFGELLLFSIFLILYLPPIGSIPFLNRADLFTNYINWISTGIVVLMILIKRKTGVTNDSTFGGKSNILVVGMFLVVEGLFKAMNFLQGYEVMVKTFIIWLAFLIFAAVLIVSFMRASSREMY